MGLGLPFHHEFTRDPMSQDITFRTLNVRNLLIQLEYLFDFGATSAYEVLHVQETEQQHGYNPYNL